MKKKSKKRINKVLVNLQVVCTVVAVLMFGVFLFNSNIGSYLQLFLGFSLFLVAYNNYVIYKSRIITALFCIVGVVLVSLFIINL